MYASPMHMCILLYVIMTQLQSVVTAIHEYGIYETACNSSVNSCIKAAVTFALSLVLPLKFVEGPVEPTTLKVDDFTAFSFPYLMVYYPFPFQQFFCLVLLGLLSEFEDLHLLYYWLQQLLVVK